MTTVVISPFNVVNYPDGGGHCWVYMQYAQGLRQLGCEVYWLEHFRSSGDKNHDTSLVSTFAKQMEQYGLGEKLILYAGREEVHGRSGPCRYIGVEQSEAEAIFREADLLLNFNCRIDSALLAYFRRTALVDIDPGLLQFWMSSGQLRVPRHDVYFTIGETVGTPSAVFPDCGLPWIHILPPVCVELWPYVYDERREAFTTVSTWWGDEWVTDGKALYENNKRVSFLEFAELPRRTSQVLELALCLGDGDVGDRQVLVNYGWRVRQAREVAGTPEMYRSYIQRSRGEFSCAKPSCVKFQNAWISDRTLCYLASGKPAVVQHTGPSRFLPDSAGLFRFRNLEEAARYLEAAAADYARHCREARTLVEEYFDARKVARRILEHALA